MPFIIAHIAYCSRLAWPNRICAQHDRQSGTYPRAVPRWTWRSDESTTGASSSDAAVGGSAVSRGSRYGGSPGAFSVPLGGGRVADGHSGGRAAAQRLSARNVFLQVRHWCFALICQSHRNNDTMHFDSTLIRPDWTQSRLHRDPTYWPIQWCGRSLSCLAIPTSRGCDSGAPNWSNR